MSGSRLAERIVEKLRWELGRSAQWYLRVIGRLSKILVPQWTDPTIRLSSRLKVSHGWGSVRRDYVYDGGCHGHPGRVGLSLPVDRRLGSGAASTRRECQGLSSRPVRLADIALSEVSQGGSRCRLSIHSRDVFLNDQSSLAVEMRSILAARPGDRGATLDILATMWGGSPMVPRKLLDRGLRHAGFWRFLLGAQPAKRWRLGGNKGSIADCQQNGKWRRAPGCLGHPSCQRGWMASGDNLSAKFWDIAGRRSGL